MRYKHLKEISAIHQRITADPYNVPHSIYPKAWQDEFRSVYGFSMRAYVLHCKDPVMAALDRDGGASYEPATGSNA
jgi:hypothetical protein